MSVPRVSVIVVSWNAREHLAACLDRLSHQEPHELIVVDNGSTDGGLDMLRARDDLRLIELENPGFGAANNVGAEHASGRYLLLLNSDCELRAGTLDMLADYLDRDPQVAVVGPMLRFPDGRLQRSMGRAPSLLTELLNKTMLHRIFPYWTYSPGTYYSERDADWVTAACMLVRRDAFAAVEGFDEHFFMFMEDLDLCKRVRDAGYRVRYTPAAEAVHHLGGSRGTVHHSMVLEGERSVRRYFRKHHTPRAMKALRLLSALEAALRSAAWLPMLMRPSQRAAARERLRAYPSLAKRDLNTRAAPQARGKASEDGEVLGIGQALEQQQRRQVNDDPEWHGHGQAVPEPRHRRG
jgi:N-acetylglucosaminyl-diphospho-decaprenol L-rhamnosyltransferase